MIFRKFADKFASKMYTRKVITVASVCQSKYRQLSEECRGLPNFLFFCFVLFVCLFAALSLSLLLFLREKNVKLLAFDADTYLSLSRIHVSLVFDQVYFK